VIGLVEETGMRQRYAALMVLPITAVLAELSYRFVENGMVRIRPASSPRHAASGTRTVC
jgi:peptidoglycan/LPS O-acetylase OafA/YrhL